MKEVGSYSKEFMQSQGRRTEDKADEQQPQELITKELEEGLICGDMDRKVCRTRPRRAFHQRTPRTDGPGPRYHLADVTVDLAQMFLGPFPQTCLHTGEPTHGGEGQKRAVEEEREEAAALRLVCSAKTRKPPVY